MTVIVRYEVAARINSSTAEVKHQWFHDAEAAMDYFKHLKYNFNHVTMYGLSEDCITDILLSYDAVPAAA